MRKQCIGILILVFSLDSSFAQDKKIDKFRVGGGSASATQMSLWLAKEGNYYEKNGLSVEAISIPGSSLALQAMLAGDLPIIQLGGAASIQANFSGADTVIIATIVRKLEAEYHINGVVTTRRFVKAQEDTVRRFLKAYVEGAARGQRDKNFALKVMGKYFRTDDREILEESYETTIKSNFSIPPYPSIPGIESLLQGLEKQNPKARGAKPEDFADRRLMRELDQSGFVKSVLAER